MLSFFKRNLVQKQKPMFRFSYGRQVHECLHTFPKKVIELNKNIETYIPESVKLAFVRNNDGTSYASSELTSYRFTANPSLEDWPTMVPEYSGETFDIDKTIYKETLPKSIHLFKSHTTRSLSTTVQTPCLRYFNLP